MIRIAHRGNYAGKNESRENRVDYITEALDAGYSVEVDVHFIENQLWLGHDEPQEKIDIEFLENPLLWVHSKNLAAMFVLWPMPLVNTFWHDKDAFTVTSKGFRWSDALQDMTRDGICVMPDRSAHVCGLIKSGTYKPMGICSDDFRLFSQLSLV